MERDRSLKFLDFSSFYIPDLMAKKNFRYPFWFGLCGVPFLAKFPKMAKNEWYKKIKFFFSNEVSKPTKSTPGNPFLRWFFSKKSFFGPLRTPFSQNFENLDFFKNTCGVSIPAKMTMGSSIMTLFLQKNHFLVQLV